MGASSGEFTQAGWETDNIAAEVAELKSRGVVFEEYDLPGFRDGKQYRHQTGPNRSAMG